MSSILINDAIGLILIAVGLLITLTLRRANRRASPPAWAVAELPTLLGQTLAVGLVAVGIGLFLHNTFG